MGSHSDARGNMDIRDQKETFEGFLSATVWTSCFVIQTVALLTLAFAIGFGWWSGLAAFAVIGIAIGFAFKLPGVFWATQIVLWVLMGIGGMIVPAVSGLMG